MECRREPAREEALATFSRYYLSEQLSDVQFEVNGERLPAHRFVLAARSDYWRTMLFGSTASSSREGTSGVITPDCTVAALKVILRHVYTFETEAALVADGVTVRVVLEIAVLSEMYELPKLRDACVAYQTERLCVENACSMLQGGLDSGLPDFAKVAEAFSLANGDAILRTPDFFALSPKVLAQVVSHKDLSVTSEVEIFRAVAKYADKHAEGESDEVRRELVADALKGIRYSEMTIAALSTTVATSNLLTTEELMPLLLYVGSKGLNGSPFGSVGPRSGTQMPYQIFVKSISTNKTYTIKVESEDTIKSVKQKVHEKNHIPPYHQRLWYGVKVLKDDFTLSTYDIRKESTLHLVDTKQTMDEGDSASKLGLAEVVDSPPKKGDGGRPAKRTRT